MVKKKCTFEVCRFDAKGRRITSYRSSKKAATALALRIKQGRTDGSGRNTYVEMYKSCKVGGRTVSKRGVRW